LPAYIGRWSSGLEAVIVRGVASANHGKGNKRDQVRRFAVGLPDAYEDFPWGELALKVNGKVFAFLGGEEAVPQAMSVKLRESHDHALDSKGAAPTGYGLGRAGWVSVPLASSSPPVGVLCDWVEESYRIVAPKRTVARLDTARAAAPADGAAVPQRSDETHGNG
jgi:predicted DNA-binding protein (MmcQ/YjbR family)